MFRSTARSLRSWWTDFSDDILGADLPASVYDEDVTDESDIVDYFINHPHRRPLPSARPRRAGTVPSRPAHCLSPVRSTEWTETAQPARH